MASSSYRILVVDDHADTVNVLARLLRMRGHQVHTAGSVEQGQALCRRESFDLLISDIGLPDGDGSDLMRYVACQQGIDGIALTGHAMEGEVEEHLRAGFAEHLTKPVTIEALIASVERVMARHMIA